MPPSADITIYYSRTTSVKELRGLMNSIPFKTPFSFLQRTPRIGRANFKPVRTVFNLFLFALVLHGCAILDGGDDRDKPALDTAFEQRGLVLKQDNKLALADNPVCREHSETPEKWRFCMMLHSESINTPPKNFSDVEPQSISKAELIKALPSDADFSRLARQKKSFRAGKYITWSGKIKNFPTMHTSDPTEYEPPEKEDGQSDITQIPPNETTTIIE
jgi:hypothetical protein